MNILRFQGLVCQDRFEAFGCAGRADPMQPIALDAMVERCA